MVIKKSERLRMMTKKLGDALGNYFQVRENVNTDDVQMKMYAQSLKSCADDKFANANEVQLRNFAQMKGCGKCERHLKKKGCGCEK